MEEREHRNGGLTNVYSEKDFKTYIIIATNNNRWIKDVY